MSDKYGDLEHLFFWVEEFMVELSHALERDDADELDLKSVEYLRSFMEVKKLIKGLKKRNKTLRFHSREEVMKRYPLLTAHLICVSLGYACPSVAAQILLDYTRGKDNYCEWIDACYKGKPKPPIEQAYTSRKRHTGYMAEITTARALVERAIKTGQEPMFASWF